MRHYWEKARSTLLRHPILRPERPGLNWAAYRHNPNNGILVPWVNLLGSSSSTSASQRATGKSRLSAPVPKLSTSRGLRAKLKLTSGCKEADA
jgi:hypothetical protein